jgi:hypothetical protein
MTAVIRYQTRPETAEENQRLIEAVFTALAATTVPGLLYSAFRLDDGVTFVHVVDGEGLPDLTAFQEFQRGLEDRLTIGPVRETATMIGTHTPHSAAQALPLGPPTSGESATIAMCSCGDRTSRTRRAPTEQNRHAALAITVRNDISSPRLA